MCGDGIFQRKRGAYLANTMQSTEPRKRGKTNYTMELDKDNNVIGGGDFFSFFNKKMTYCKTFHKNIDYFAFVLKESILVNRRITVL